MSDAFTPAPLFSYPVFSAMLGDFERHREPLVEEILALKARSPGVRKSNRGAWHSGDDFETERSEHFTWVLQAVTTYARRAVGQYHQGWAHSELRMGKFWANVLGPGGWNAPHHHFPSAWSGAYYVSVGETGDGVDDMSGMIEFLNPNPAQAMYNRSGNFATVPKDGLVVLFPSTLVHFVHPTHAAQRISIAFNFSVVPRG